MRISTFKKNKKGNAIIEVLVILITVFAFSLIAMFVHKSFSEIVDDGDELFTSNESIKVLETTQARYPSFFDGAVVFVLVGLWIGALVLSFMIESHPIFFIISILLLIFCLVGVIFLQNMYEEFFLADSEMNDLVTEFPMINWINQHLVPLAIVMGFSILIVLYGKTMRS